MLDKYRRRRALGRKHIPSQPAENRILPVELVGSNAPARDSVANNCGALFV